VTLFGSWRKQLPLLAWFQTSATKQIRNALFWVITQN